jgi:hypothetical protein
MRQKNLSVIGVFRRVQLQRIAGKGVIRYLGAEGRVFKSRRSDHSAGEGGLQYLRGGPTTPRVEEKEHHAGPHL